MTVRQRRQTHEPLIARKASDLNTHPWSEVRDRLKADPERWERIEAGKEALRAVHELAALREYIAAIGGELRVSVVFPDQAVDLVGPTA